MLRLRFSSGLVLGLLLGVPVGTLIGFVVLSARTPDPGISTAMEVAELTRKLEIARDQKERVDRQLDQFTKLAEQMTVSFNTLERRFKALEESQSLRDARNPSAPQTPTPAPAPQGQAAPPAAGQPPAAAATTEQAPAPAAARDTQAAATGPTPQTP